MKEPKKHLDIDLEFLDKDKPIQSADKTEPTTGQTSNTKKSPSTNRKYNWKNILIIGGVVLFFVWVIFSDDSSSSSNYTPPTSNSNSAYFSDDDLVQVGEYMCSRYHYNKADELEPDESALTFEQNLLISSGNEVDRLANELEYSYVNEYSAQWEIDEYNAKVAEYNRKLTSYNRDAESMDSKIDRHNERVEIYNNYLIQNCTPNR